MKFGYARVSTDEQSLKLQIDALKDAGVELDNIFTEKISGSTKDRPELNRLKEKLRSGDVVVVWKLDRLGRSLRHLIDLITGFKEAGVEFESIQDKIDTSSPTGTLTFHIFAALAQFERELISERTKAGLRASHRKGGRPKGLSKKAEHKARLAESLYKEGALSVKEICDHLDISKPSLYRYLKYRKVKIKSA